MSYRAYQVAGSDVTQGDGLPCNLRVPLQRAWRSRRPSKPNPPPFLPPIFLTFSFYSLCIFPPFSFSLWSLRDIASFFPFSSLARLNVMTRDKIQLGPQYSSWTYTPLIIAFLYTRSNSCSILRYLESTSTLNLSSCSSTIGLRKSHFVDLNPRVKSF